MKRKNIYIILFVLLAGVTLLFRNKKEESYIYNEGYIFGTTYHISYESMGGEDYGTALHEHLIDVVDFSLSPFNKKSIISAVNENKAHETNAPFEKVFNTAHEISEMTDGAFDMTIAPLVNLWGFGYTEKINITPSEGEIKALLATVGYNKIKIVEHTVIKENPKIKIDASAIAKGYSVDVASEFLIAKGITNFMVEIGGEIRVGGFNKTQNKWRLGIDKPIDDVTASVRELDTVIHVTDKAIATSGNYRQFYYKDGKRYSHTVNPHTGYPVNHNLLSATVIAKDCMTADAIATACMVMGAEKSLKLASEHPEIDIFLIVDDEGKTQELYSDGLEQYLHP